LRNPINIRYVTPGTYDVILTITNGFTSSTKTKTGFITVLPTPLVHLGNDTSICAWNSIVLDAGVPNAVYLWSTGATTQSIVADSTGVGYGNKEFRVIVSEGATCFGRDTINISFETCVGIVPNETSPVVTIYPNPATQQFRLEIKGCEGGRWTLSSIQGVEINHTDIISTGYLTTVETTNIPQGIYFLQVRKKDLAIVKKVIIL